MVLASEQDLEALIEGLLSSGSFLVGRVAALVTWRSDAAAGAEASLDLHELLQPRNGLADRLLGDRELPRDPGDGVPGCVATVSSSPSDGSVSGVSVRPASRPGVALEIPRHRFERTSEPHIYSTFAQTGFGLLFRARYRPCRFAIWPWSRVVSRSLLSVESPQGAVIRHLLPGALLRRLSSVTRVRSVVSASAT